MRNFLLYHWRRAVGLLRCNVELGEIFQVLLRSCYSVIGVYSCCCLIGRKIESDVADSNLGIGTNFSEIRTFNVLLFLTIFCAVGGANQIHVS